MSPFSLSALMVFYRPDAAMDQWLSALVRRLAAERDEDLAGGLSITWLRYPASLLTADREQRGPGATHPDNVAVSASRACGASWQGAWLRDPGDLVRLPYLIACERWLQRGLLEEEPELSLALLAMIRQGSHDATSYVVDRLSGTTSGPALAASGYATWLEQRGLVSGWLTSLGWSELEGCSAVQKTWQDGPYGRERQSLGPALENANRFSSDGLARLLEGVLAGTLISPPACQRMRSLLAVPEPQAAGSAGDHQELMALLPAALRGSVRFWGQGGRGRCGLQLACYAEADRGAPVLLVVLADRTAIADPQRLVAAVAAGLLGAEATAG